MFIVKPTLTEEEIKSQISSIEELITKNGGEIAATLDVGMRQLAYEIEKCERGYYYVIYFKSPAESIKELERNYNINENILRHIFIGFKSAKEIKNWQSMVEKAAKPQ
jgi:small subunit ribosomal protein S6